jgi:hypothetical protein
MVVFMLSPGVFFEIDFIVLLCYCGTATVVNSSGAPPSLTSRHHAVICLSLNVCANINYIEIKETP